jgi:hypothetical protein
MLRMGRYPKAIRAGAARRSMGKLVQSGEVEIAVG